METEVLVALTLVVPRIALKTQYGGKRQLIQLLFI